ncbi:uncharacterized protein METZ01_LOCUS368745 [marine metagenome]|uniref:Uncharacterized protein n=1 Tax=marine metagenome TaxID=408172 RepID=A0A382T3N3_9ZZZZ
MLTQMLQLILHSQTINNTPLNQENKMLTKGKLGMRTTED